ncbi:S-layer homology domain-containing protein [Paenibacillus arenosi]|uniref:S-layer homology domain-containing protein n=1 Tax=Paenibacillus arenosi TaxID=2774142 RepID=A0ABR9ASY7_9BACL|nr:S-layer homology domain-containing protein [Paenibacillus arenosi]MBD8497237.1 S-layer homology domain-containing protein [Paenibacillus arenosi]
MGNKRSFISFIMMTMLMVSIPVVASATDVMPALKLDTSTKYPGDAIHITGTSSLSDVIVKIVRPDETVLYYNAVKVNQSSYNDSITLPTDAMPGDYTVVVGQGGPDQLLQQSFTVVKKPNGGDGNSGGGDSGSSGSESGAGNNGGANGNGSGSNNGRDSSSGETPPTTEDAAITVKENGSSITAIIPSSALKVTKENENGAATTKIIVDGAALSAAFDTLKVTSNKNGKSLKVGITVPERSSDVERTKVELPVGVLKDAQGILPQAIVSIQTHGASMELPLKGLNTAHLERSLNTSTANMNIVVTTTTLPDLITAKDKQSMLAGGIVKVTEPVSFNVACVAHNGKQITMSALGDEFVNKTLTIRSTFNIDPKKSTVVAVDPGIRKTRFVPSVFQKTTDGVTNVQIKDHASSEIYMIVSSTAVFKDTIGHWAQSSIEHLTAKQIVKGVSINSFDPNGKVTRAEFAAMLVRAAGWKGSSQLSASSFKDVQANDWFAVAVQTAVERGLVKGMQDGTFQPNVPISREQMAGMLERFMKLVDAELQGKSENVIQVANHYKDVSHISSWARSSMAGLVSNKLMVGIDEHKLAPQAQTTRAETVKILERCLRYAKLINE